MQHGDTHITNKNKHDEVARDKPGAGARRARRRCSRRVPRSVRLPEEQCRENRENEVHTDKNEGENTETDSYTHTHNEQNKTSTHISLLHSEDMKQSNLDAVCLEHCATTHTLNEHKTKQTTRF